MKNINKISTIMNKTLVWVFVIMLSITPAFAEDPTALPDAPLDEPAAAPIDGYVWVLALIGLFYVYLRLRAFTKQANTESKQ
jgi:hypothetical protein